MVGEERGGVEKFHSEGRDEGRGEEKGGSKLPIGKAHFSEITTTKVQRLLQTR